MVNFSEQVKTTLDAFVSPVWLIDVQHALLVWANQSALTLFGSLTLNELLAREPMRGASAILVTELARLSLGARLESEFRIQTSNSELLVGCTFTGIDDQEGRRLALVEAHTTHNAPTSLRGPDVEQRLQSRDRMASLGSLTAGVVHGINNPLSYVIANLEYVKRLLSGGPEGLAQRSLAELGDVLDDSLDGAERVRRIVSDLGSFSLPTDARVCAVDLERATLRALSLADNEIRHRARVVQEFSGVVPAVGTEAKLAQVILNVLINAAHSIEPGAVDSNVISLRTRLDALGRPSLQIDDTGCGIAAENLSRVFDPFFTTKPVGVGTGLGLSIAQRIMHELDGDIQLESVHGEGTRVTLTLPAAPLAQLPAPVLESMPAAVTPESGRARILVIDDESAILRAFRRALSWHEVSVVTSGAAAMAELESGAGFDVIFCDVMMPEMSGIEVYQRIRERHPGQENKIVFMTGGTFTEAAARFIDSVENRTMKKPFTRSSLRALLAKVRLPP